MKVVFAQVVALAVGASAFNGEIHLLGNPCRAWGEKCLLLEFG